MKKITRKRFLKNEVTSLVVSYKRTKDQKTLKTILTKTDKLIKHILYINWIKSTCGEEYMNEIYDDCRTLIILKSIDRYQVSKRMQFSSYFCMWLHSYIRNKKEVYENRKMLYNTLSLDKRFSSEIDSNFHNILSQYDFDYMIRMKSNFQNDLEKGKLYEPLIKGETFYETPIQRTKYRLCTINQDAL